jgi:hypothetical protein
LPLVEHLITEQRLTTRDIKKLRALIDESEATDA